MFSTIGRFIISLVPMGEAVAPPVRGPAGEHAAAVRDNVQAAQAGQLRFPPPSEENILSLMSLGFDRNAVLAALQTTGNNVEAAANRLLGGF